MRRLSTDQAIILSMRKEQIETIYDLKVGDVIKRRSTGEEFVVVSARLGDDRIGVAAVALIRDEDVSERALVSKASQEHVPEPKDTRHIN